MRCWGAALAALVVLAASSETVVHAEPAGLGGAPDIGSWVDRGLRILPDAAHLKLTSSQDRPVTATDIARRKQDAFMPHASFVARDWGSALGVMGDALPTDFIRITRSSRMGLFRLTLGDGMIRPYLHTALGEWRYDHDLLPYLPKDQEYASQFAGGMAVRIGKTTVACEADYTVLLREKREPQNLPTPHVLGAFAVLDTHF